MLRVHGDACRGKAAFAVLTGSFMKSGNLGHPHESPTDKYPESKRETVADASGPEFRPNANAAKRAGLTARDVIRLKAQAQLVGANLFEVPKFERASYVDPRDVRGSHRAQAAAKLVGQPLPSPSEARFQAHTRESTGSSAIAAPVVAMEKAIALHEAAEGVAPVLGERKS